MYEASYSYRSGRDDLLGLSQKPSNQTVLIAEFSFKHSDNTKEIRDRCNPEEVKNFLLRKLGYHHPCHYMKNIRGGQCVYKDTEQVRVKKAFLGGGFTIISKAQGVLRLEQMIDLDAVNNFVLNGIPSEGNQQT